MVLCTRFKAVPAQLPAAMPMLVRRAHSHLWNSDFFFSYILSLQISNARVVPYTRFEAVPVQLPAVMPTLVRCVQSHLWNPVNAIRD